MSDPFKFNKGVYWSRRKKGYRGQIATPGSKEQNYERKRMERLMHEEKMKKLRGKDESKKVKTV